MSPSAETLRQAQALTVRAAHRQALNKALEDLRAGPFTASGNTNPRNHTELDLTDQSAIDAFRAHGKRDSMSCRE